MYNNYTYMYVNMEIETNKQTNKEAKKKTNSFFWLIVKLNLWLKNPLSRLQVHFLNFWYSM